MAEKETKCVSEAAAFEEPFRDTDYIPAILYNRAVEQEKRLLDTRKRETFSREKIGKAKKRLADAKMKFGKILPKKAAVYEQLQRKELKIQELQERTNVIKRYKDNCRLYMERGNKRENRVQETRDKINEVIRKEYENEQKLVIVFRRKDYLERLISRKQEKHAMLREKFEDFLKRQHDIVARHNEVRGNIQESISRAKSAFEKCIEIAPKLLGAQKKVRLLEAGIYGIEMKINKKEDELKKTRKDIEYRKHECDRMKIEQMVKLERKMRKLEHK